MIQCLRKNLLYSEKRVRDILFRAARQEMSWHLQNQSTVMLARLAREIESLGRQWGADAAVEVTNWHMPTKAVVNTMLRAGVLLAADHRPIPPGLSANAAAIAALAPDFETRSEVFLVEFLIRKLGDVTTRDHKAMAHALLRQFDPNVPMDDMEDHISVLISRLEGSVVLTEDGLYSPVASA